MVKLVALFRRPKDPQGFMNRFIAGHEPLVRELPELQRIELSSPFDTMGLGGRGGDRRGPPFLMAELYFADRAAFDTAMSSPAGHAVIEDLREFAGDQVSMFLAEVEREDPAASSA